jgi:hypothetical protein
LGDAILDFLVTQHIYNNCKKDLKPGELTDLRSALVNNNIFAVIAVQNNYHQYLKEHSPHLFSNIGHFVKGVNLYLKHLDSKVSDVSVFYWPLVLPTAVRILAPSRTTSF